MTNAKDKDLSALSPARELLARKEAGPGPHALHALDHLAFAIAHDGCGEPLDIVNALTRLRREYVDWNEVRVARVQELARTLAGLADAERCAKRIREEYNGFFEKKGALDFEFLAAGKPAEVRRTLTQLLPSLGKGAVAILLFEFCPGATLPLSDEALKLARRDGIISKSGDRGQLVRVLAEGLKLSEAARLLQYWELEATGTPYGELNRSDARSAKNKKTSSKGKAKSAAAKAAEDARAAAEEDDEMIDDE